MDSIHRQLLLQVVLILINAFFAATEIAVISLNGTKLEKKIEEGDHTAEKLLKLVEEPSGFLSTIQIGITLAGFLGSAFAAENFSGLLADWLWNDLDFQVLPLYVLNTVSLILITIILSYFTLVFGELVPKRIAMQKPYEVAKLSCGVVRAVAFVMKPVICFLSLSTNAILRILHMKVEAEEESVSEEEIRMMVDLGEKRGVLDEEEKEWITNVFEFDEQVLTNASSPFRVKRFEDYCEEWAEFVFANRNNAHRDRPVHDYDIVYGPIANDRVGLQIRN